MVNNLLSRAESRIRDGYAELGHDQGWSFLYTPGATLNSQARFLFMGLNPGGEGEPNSVSLTTEKGNAYHPEVESDWLGNGKPSPLQSQVVALYDRLRRRIDGSTRTLMDSTLAANFCPFRSSSWSALKNQEATIKFSYDLWADIFQELELTTIVCMSLLVFDKMSSIATITDGKEVASEEKYIGWGKVKYRYKKIQYADHELFILCLPHLSRYKVFASPNCSSELDRIIDAVATSLAGWIPQY